MWLPLLFDIWLTELPIYHSASQEEVKRLWQKCINIRTTVSPRATRAASVLTLILRMNTIRPFSDCTLDCIWIHCVSPLIYFLSQVVPNEMNCVFSLYCITSTAPAPSVGKIHAHIYTYTSAPPRTFFTSRHCNNSGAMPHQWGLPHSLTSLLALLCW